MLFADAVALETELEVNTGKSYRILSQATSSNSNFSGEAPRNTKDPPRMRMGVERLLVVEARIEPLFRARSFLNDP